MLFLLIVHDNLNLHFYKITQDVPHLVLNLHQLQFQLIQNWHLQKKNDLQIHHYLLYLSHYQYNRDYYYYYCYYYYYYYSLHNPKKKKKIFNWIPINEIKQTSCISLKIVTNSCNGLFEQFSKTGRTNSSENPIAIKSE